MVRQGKKSSAGKNFFTEKFQEHLAGEPKLFTYEVKDTDRKLAGIRAAGNGEDSMDTYFNSFMQLIQWRLFYEIENI